MDNCYNNTTVPTGSLTLSKRRQSGTSTRAQATRQLTDEAPGSLPRWRPFGVRGDIRDEQ